MKRYLWTVFVLILIFLLPSCSGSETNQASVSEQWAMKPCLMVDGQLYFTTGGRSHVKTHPEEFDGYITEEVPGTQLPTENGQANFGSDFGYNYGQVKGTVEIYYNDDWWLYALKDLDKEVYTQVVAPFDTQDDALTAYLNMQETFDKDGDGFVGYDEFPQNYGGCYIDRNNVLNICVSSVSSADFDFYQEACGTKNIYLQPIAYTREALKDAMDAITEYNENHDPQLCYSWGMDEKNNCVSITITSDMISEAEELRKLHPCIVYEIDVPTLVPAVHENQMSRDDITLTPEYNVYPTDIDTIAFFFKNGSDRSIPYPDEYLEILIDGVWHTIPYRSDVAFTAMLPGIDSGKTTTVYEKTGIRNFTFVPGTYRFGIGYCYDTNYNGDNADHIAWAEFELRDDATLPEYCPLEEQSTDVNTAVMDGCAVLVNGSMVNSEAVHTFCNKALAKMQCELRLIDRDEDVLYHITYMPDRFTVDILQNGTTQTRGFAALCLYTGDSGQEVVLTTYRNLPDAIAEGHPVLYGYDLLPLLSKATAQDQNSFQLLSKAIATDTELRLDQNITYQQITLPPDEGVVSFTRSDFEAEREYDLAISNSGGGKMIGYGYTESQDHPIYLFPAKDRKVGVVFSLSAGGEEIRMFDPDAEEFTETISVTDDLEETILNYRTD